MILLLVLLSSAANAQDSWGHEYRGELPVYIDSRIATDGMEGGGKDEDNGVYGRASASV